MPIKTLSLQDFSGGIAQSEKKDVPFSARFVKNLNPYEDPAYITLSKKASKVSGTTVTGLCYWMEDGSPYDTNEYFYDSAGKIYRETSAGVWSSLRTVSGGAGEGLKIFDDYLYYALGTDLGRYGRLSGTPAFSDSLYTWWGEASDDITTTGGGTGQTYSVTTSINEGATHRQTFTATHDPLKSITITITNGAEIDWTLTLHDADNNVIGTYTWEDMENLTTEATAFTFTTPPRLIIGNEYHFHVTVSATTGSPTIVTNVASDLEGATFTARYGVLIDKDFHPMVVVEDKLIIGNGEYLAVFDQSTYDPNKILLERGYEVRSIATNDEYVVVSCFKGATIDTAEESKNFYWDTISPSYNYFDDTTSIGAGNAITNTNNKLRGIYGNRGSLYVSAGSEQGVIYQKTPKLARGKKVNVYPSAIDNYNGITLIGIGGNTDDATGLEQGIYAYGSQNKNVGDALVLLHTISTGTTQGTTLKIGFVKTIGENLYFSWRDNTSYGVDKITPTALSVASGVYEGLIFDNGSVNKEKLAIKLQAECATLATNETLSVKYKVDRDSSFTAGDNSTAGDTSAEVSIYKRFKEIEFGMTIGSTNGTYPKITEISLDFNDLGEEKRI